jgi:hypothetical protein
MRIHALRRALPLSLLAAVATFVSAAPANASLLAGSAQNCASAQESQIFLPWADPASYVLAPGGNFEAGAPTWSLSGGAATVAGNESFGVGGASDSQSLSLPGGSSATSPAMCVGIDKPDLRFFALNTGDPTSTLAVSVNYTGPLGLQLTTQIGTIANGGTWQPTLQDPILVNLLPLLPGNETPVSFTFTPQDSRGNWQIDDVYVDPMGRG